MQLPPSGQRLRLWHTEAKQVRPLQRFITTRSRVRGRDQAGDCSQGRVIVHLSTGLHATVAWNRAHTIQGSTKTEGWAGHCDHLHGERHLQRIYHAVHVRKRVVQRCGRDAHNVGLARVSHRSVLAKRFLEGSHCEGGCPSLRAS